MTAPVDSEDDKPATRREMLKESWGCPVPRVLKFHDFQWGFGPDAVIDNVSTTPGVVMGNVLDTGGGWWMYCTRCGKGAWR